MYQECPICKGMGVIPNYGPSSEMNKVCPVCKGAMIINDLTGRPPEDKDKVEGGVSEIGKLLDSNDEKYRR